MKQIVINADNIKALKEYPDNYFDAVVTDPPYGLGKEPDAAELMKDWVEKGYHEITGTGFMGKEWDAFVPQPIFWKEVFRVLKHGGHVVSFFGTRTYDWGVMAMRFAGFEVRDCIQWIYGSGFPKSHNISKAIDKVYGAEREVVGKGKSGNPKTHTNMNMAYKEGSKSIMGGEFDITAPSTKEAKEWDGWGSALKPANEPIVLARKPLEKGLSIAENVLKWGTGGINIDGCRVRTLDTIPSVEGGIKRRNKINQEMGFRKYENGFDNQDKEVWEQNSEGRFPANLILTHHPECECKGLKKVKTGKNIEEKGSGGIWHKSSGLPVGNQYGDENGEETIEDWDCHEDCPIKIMDEQSGISKGTIRKPNGKAILDINNGWNDNSMVDCTIRGHSDSGGASRFFYCAKASKSERNQGLDGFEEKEISKKKGNGLMRVCNICGENILKKCACIGNEWILPISNKNFHPTVKPIKLMQYLVRLITPPNGKVLDPFCGSGTTGVACKLEGFEFVGLEQDPEYTKIAQARIENFVEEKETIKVVKNDNDNTKMIQSTLF